MSKLEIVTAERRQHDKLRVGDNFASVENSTLIEKLYARGVFGEKHERGKIAERRRDNGLWLIELYAHLYGSEGVAKYQAPGTGGKEYEMSDAEAELRAMYHRYLRASPAAVTQMLRFVCLDQQLPRVHYVLISECLDKLGEWRREEKRQRGGCK